MVTVSDNPKLSPTQIAAQDLIRRRKQDFHQTFDLKSMACQRVLADLARFCRALPTQTVFDPDPRVHALLTGRNEVFKRIANHLNLSEDDLYSIFVEGRN